MKESKMFLVITHLMKIKGSQRNTDFRRKCCIHVIRKKSHSTIYVATQFRILMFILSFAFFFFAFFLSSSYTLHHSQESIFFLAFYSILFYSFILSICNQPTAIREFIPFSHPPTSTVYIPGLSCGSPTLLVNLCSLNQIGSSELPWWP